MTNIGIKSSQLSDIRATLLDNSKNNTLEQGNRKLWKPNKRCS